MKKNTDKEKEQELFEFMVNAKLSYHFNKGDIVIEPFESIELGDNDISKLESITDWSWDFRPCELEYIVMTLLDDIVGELPENANIITCENIKWIDADCNDTKAGLPDKVEVIPEVVFPNGLSLNNEGGIDGDDVDRIAKYLHNRFGAFPVSLDTRIS